MTRTPRPVVAFALSFLAAALLTPPALAAVFVYNCVLNPRQEAPTPVVSTALGGGRFVIDTDANTVTFRIAWSGLSSAETAAHIHGFAAPGVNAGVLFALPAGNPKVGVWNYDEGQEASILGGLCYANIHSGNNPGGEIRGQITAFNALLDAGQESPVNASTGSGWATGTVDIALNQIRYYIFYEGLTGPVTQAHFHGNALHGTSVGVKVGLTVTPSPMTGTVGYLEADEAALLAGRWYVNLHTGANLGGEIRGQFVPRVIPIDPLQEIPAVTEPASAGFALVAIDTALNAMSFDERILGLSSLESAAHIHGPAPADSNAGVLFTQAVGNRKLGVWNYGSANEFTVLTRRTYFNIHTANHPGGEMRGQILDGPIPPDLVGVDDSPRFLAGLAASPNPSMGRTQFAFQLARTGPVSMRIIGVDGRCVRALPEATFAPGRHALEWDGRDDAGRNVAPGVYFAIVRTAEGEKLTRVARLR